MKRSQLWLLTAAAVTAAVAAEALPIDNRVNPDGTPVLLPTVREYQPRKGTIALPKEITVTAPAKADNEADVLKAEFNRYFPGVSVSRADADGFCR